MVPLATVIVTGAVGEISSASNAGEAVTCATGFGTTVVLGAAEELLPLLDDSDSDSVEAPVGVCAAWLTLSGGTLRHSEAGRRTGARGGRGQDADGNQGDGGTTDGPGTMKQHVVLRDDC